ncbi:MAG: DUF1156 domain-containing protein [Candidatus Methanosuratincola petrocarbonis]
MDNKSVEHLKLFADVSEEARKEKLGRPPISEMIYWWTRKPLIVGRTVTLLSLLPENTNLADVKPLLGLGREKRAFNYAPKLESIKKNAGKPLDSLTVFDPFAGAGNLLFEAARLGPNCTAMDYNPVAHIILKATLEYPAVYGERLAEDVERYGKLVIERAKKEVGKFYYRKNGRQTLHYLWCWCIKCPYCGQRVPLTNQMWLDKKRKTGYRIKPTKDNDFEIEVGMVSDKEGSKYTQKDGEATCIKCKNAISYQHMTKDIAERRDKQMIAVVVKAQKGKDYEPFTMEDIELFNKATAELKDQWANLISQDLIPQEELKESELFRVTNYGLKKWFEFFNERQLLLMSTLLRIIRDVCSEIVDKEYRKAIATYLGLMMCKHVDHNCIGVRWDPTKQITCDSLSMRSPRIIYNFAETNPFEKTSGSFHSVLRNVVDAVSFAALNKTPAKVLRGSAVNMAVSNKFDLVLTDPPYMEDVAYAELSEFFYVWLTRVLRDYYPELPSTVPSDEDLVLSKGRFGGNEKLALEFYKKGMTLAFQNIYKSLKDDGLLVVFFAHSSTEAWDLLLEVLRGSRFRVVSSYAVHTESTENPLARGKTSFMSSIVLSCRKILEDKEAYFESLMPRVEEEIKELIEGLSDEDLLSLPITDLLIMAYGKVLEELTQYSQIKSYRADFKAKFEDLIGEARDFIFREVVRKLTGRSLNILGPEASFALITKIFYRSSIPSDEALKVVRAYGLTVDALVKKGYAKKISGGIEITPFTEVPLDISPEEVERNNLYQQLLYLLKTANEKGAPAIKQLLSSYGNFGLQELQYIINLLTKHYRLLINKGEELRDSEKIELQVLDSISDVIGQPMQRRTLDSFT